MLTSLWQGNADRASSYKGCVFVWVWNWVMKTSCFGLKEDQDSENPAVHSTKKEYPPGKICTQNLLEKRWENLKFNEVILTEWQKNEKAVFIKLTVWTQCFFSQCRQALINSKCNCFYHIKFAFWPYSNVFLQLLKERKVKDISSYFVRRDFLMRVYSR